jgi:aspartyl-tRNA(Asn)/glutamyl-tRNA(Gln) amidotransferase subunit A
MYRQDLATIPSNLYGGPAMSLPAGLSEGLPVGLQVMAPTLRDDLLYQVGGALEAALHDRWGGPLLASAPELEVSRG